MSPRDPRVYASVSALVLAGNSKKSGMAQGFGRKIPRDLE